MLLNDRDWVALDVIEEFLKDYGVGKTGSDIAKDKGLNQKTVSNYLNKLEKEGILTSKMQGKNKNYFLNLENKAIVRMFILSVENLRTMEFYKKHAVIKEICENIIKYTKGSCMIFGSYAKGLAKKDSDLDVMAIGKCEEKELDLMIKTLEKTYHIEINLKIYPKFEKDILMNEATKNHIFIKNPELIIEELLNGRN